MTLGVGENYTLRADKNTEFVVALVHKWGPACGHLVHEDAKCPPIYCEPVALHVEDLGS